MKKHGLVGGKRIDFLFFLSITLSAEGFALYLPRLGPAPVRKCSKSSVFKTVASAALRNTAKNAGQRLWPKIWLLDVTGIIATFSLAIGARAANRR
jgi:hypothetical protein